MYSLEIISEDYQCYIPIASRIHKSWLRFVY